MGPSFVRQEKRRVAPWLWEDLKPVRLFSYHRSREAGRGSMTYAPQRAARAQEHERAGRVLHLARHEAASPFQQDSSLTSTPTARKCLRVRRRPAIWRCQPKRRARRKANSSPVRGLLAGARPPQPAYRKSASSATMMRLRPCSFARATATSAAFRNLSAESSGRAVWMATPPLTVTYFCVERG